MQTHRALASKLDGPRIVLVVDDEPAVRLSLKSIIEQCFNVVVCADGPHAINFASEHPGEVSAAFVDYGMYPMNGSRVCSALRSLDATISLIGFSGIGDAPFEMPLFATLLKKHISSEYVMTFVSSAVRSSEQLRSDDFYPGPRGIRVLIFTIFTAATLLVVGFIALNQNPRRPTNRILAAVCFVAFVTLVLQFVARIYRERYWSDQQEATDKEKGGKVLCRNH